MSYKLGLCSVSFRENSPEEILHNMKVAELDVIEWGSDVHCPPEKAKEIAILQNQYGIKCCSYGTYFKIGVTPIEELSKYIVAAKTLGTSVLRLWCGNKNSEEHSEEEKRELFSRCKALATLAETFEVILCMECHNNTYTNRKESALELMQAVSSPHFRMYWQPNQLCSVDENIDYATSLAPYTQNIHVFNWKASKKYPLSEARSVWRRYIEIFKSDHALLLEFMPDGRIESLKTEAEALKEILK